MTPVFKRRLRRLIHPFRPIRNRLHFSIPKPRLSWVLVVTYAAAGIFICFGPPFRLQQFFCRTNTGEPCPDFIVPELNKKRGELAYLTQMESQINAFRHTLPQADSITIDAKWPNKLVASITWQPGVANLQIPASSSALLVSNSGQLITVLPTPDPTLPTITASSAADLIISDHLTDPSLQAALELIKQLNHVSIMVDKVIVMSPIDIRAYIQNKKIAVFTSLKSISIQVNALHIILSDPTMNPDLPIIDIRYDRPALKPALPA